MPKTVQLSFFHVGLLIFLLETVFFATLLLPSSELLRMIIGLPFVFITPGCLLMLLVSKNGVDIVELLLKGFLVSLFLGAGTSLLIGVFLGELNRVLFMSVLILVSFLSLVLVWRREVSRRSFILINKYAVLIIVLTVVYFAALMLLYTYKSPTVASSDSARYFHAAQNYIKSFSFSPYPPFPLQEVEVGLADIGGAIDFRVLWVIWVALPALIVENASVNLMRILNISLTSVLVLVTFHLGSLVRDRKLGTLAALFVALNPAMILYTPYELPYIPAILLALIAYTMYISAVGVEQKDFSQAYLSLFIILSIALWIHTTIFFFALLLISHFLFVVLKHGNVKAKTVFVILILAIGLMGLRYLGVYSSRFEQFLNTDLETFARTVYNIFLIPIYFTVPIWILFIIGILMTFAHKTYRSFWRLNLYLTLLAIPVFATIFVIFRYGTSFRFFLVLFPLIIIVAVYGLLEDVKGFRRDIVFLGVLYFIVIIYLANTYPFTVIFPFGRVTVNEVYLTFLPAIGVLAWKAFGKDGWGQRKLAIGKVRLSVKGALLSIFIIVVSVSLMSETVVYVSNPWLGVYMNPVENGLQEAGQWIDKNIESGSILATNAWTHLGLYANYTRTPVVPFPSGASSLLRWISEGKIDYLVILTNLEAPLGITWLHKYEYLKKYADPNQAPPSGTTEYCRAENFVVFKAQSHYASPIGVTGYMSHDPESCTLENGYIQLNITSNAVLLSYWHFAEFIPVSQLDFENTALRIDGASPSKLNSWNSRQWFNYAKNNWEEWTETSNPPQTLSYSQQIRVRLSWSKENFSLSMYVTLERGKPFVQIKWRLDSPGSNTVTVFPSLQIIEKLNRAYIPSNQSSEWSKHSRDRGNPGLEEMFGLGFLLSHTPQAVLAKENYTAQQLPSSMIFPEKTKIGDVEMFTYTFHVINEAETDQWAVVEAYVPDNLIDQDGDGFYNVRLQSYNVNDGRWWDFARWDSKDVGSDAATIGPWADSFRATLLDGTRLSSALGYSSSYMRGVGLYELGKRSETANEIAGVDAPANITYSTHYGLVSRLGFAIRLPGRKGEAISQLSLRLYIAYNETTSSTYEFSNSLDTHYGFGSINNPFLWLYNIDEPKPSMGLVFDMMPSFLNFTVNVRFNYTNLCIGWVLSENTQGSYEFYTNLVSIEEWPWYDSTKNDIPDTFEDPTGNTAFSATLSSLAYYNFTFEGSEDLMTITFAQSRIKNELNVEPLYIAAIDGKWTWVSGGTFLYSINGNELFDVSKASSISFKKQPKAIAPHVAFVDQTYDATEGKLRIQVASWYATKEMYGTLIVYMLKRIIVYTGDLRPTKVYVDSRSHTWQFDEATRLLKITITEIGDVEINVILT